jgi:hypothetical protein
VAWSQVDIGLVLSAGTLASLALQIPAGWAAIRVPAKRRRAVAVFAISSSALVLALWPEFGPCSSPSCCTRSRAALAGPVLAAIRPRAGRPRALVPARLGRNARFLSLGNAIAAGAMAARPAYASAIALIFFLTAALGLPRSARARREIRPRRDRPRLRARRCARARARRRARLLAAAAVARNRPLAIFRRRPSCCSSSPTRPLLADHGWHPHDARAGDGDLLLARSASSRRSSSWPRSRLRWARGAAPRPAATARRSCFAGAQRCAAAIFAVVERIRA